MSQLSRDIRSNVRSNASIPAYVVDVFFGKASVRLASNGAIYRNLDVVGGPVEIGNKVRVDFTTSKPTVVATGQKGLSLDDIKKLLAGLDLGSSGDTQITITLFSGGAVKEMYPPNELGMADAIDEASDGDVIFLPDIDIGGNYTIPDGVAVTGLSREESIIRGTITLGEESVLQNVLIYLETSSGSAYGVILGDRSRLDSCHVYVQNTGSAFGVFSNQNVDCFANDNIVQAYVTSSGLGYAYYSDGAAMYASGGLAKATTAPVGGTQE